MLLKKTIVWDKGRKFNSETAFEDPYATFSYTEVELENSANG